LRGDGNRASTMLRAMSAAAPPLNGTFPVPIS